MPPKNHLADLEARVANAATPRAKVDALNALVWELRESDAKHGLELAQAAGDLARIAQYQKGIADSLAHQSHCYCFLTRFVPAVTQALEALNLYEQMNDRAGQSDVLSVLCWAHLNLNNYAEAIELGQRAQKLAREIGDRALEGEALNHLGGAYRRTGNFELTFAVYAEALAIYRALDAPTELCLVMTNLAFAHSALKQSAQAMTWAQQAMQLENIDDVRRGFLYLALARIHTAQKEFDQALDYLHQVLDIAKQTGVDRLTIPALTNLSEIYLQLDQLELARAFFLQCLEFADKTQSNLHRYLCHQALAEIDERGGNPAQALAHYKQFHIAKELIFNETNASRLQVLEIQHKTQIARQQAEIYHLRNVELEQEIAQRQRLEAALRQQATTDELTRLSNRRHFLDLARQELLRASRFKHPLAVVLIDLDHFKQINDTYGHAAGDQALVHFADLGRKHLRTVDTLARFGGDEFAVLLPETDHLQAVEIIERVRWVIATHSLAMNGNAITLTLSAGIANLHSARADLDALLARADQALYRAKQAGRNYVEVAPESVAE